MLPMSAQAKNGNGHAAAEEEPAAATETPQEPKGNDLRQRLDQMGTILAKGLDLAEAGVSLGVTIISRVGVAAQQKLKEGLDAASTAAAEPAPPQQEQAQAEPEYGLTNRLPLAPGGTVRISFSVNNDSMTEPKKVELRVEGFAGDTQGGHLDPAQFTVKPAQKTIAPVDFEKFVLQGLLAADVPPDVYRGAVVVDSGSAFRIPVVLVVMPL
jgi:hypothetical protein